MGASRETGQSQSKRTYHGDFSPAPESSRGVVGRFVHFSPYRSEFSNLLKIASLPLIKAFQRQSISAAPGSHSTQTRICEMIYECLVWEV